VTILATVKKKRATKNTPEPEVSVNWQRTGGELSTAYVRLWRKLLASRKEKPTGTRQEGGGGEMHNENDTNIQNL